MAALHTAQPAKKPRSHLQGLYSIFTSVEVRSCALFAASVTAFENRVRMRAHIPPHSPTPSREH